MPEDLCIDHLMGFHEAVIKAIKKIPSGKLATYGCIAEVANRTRRDGPKHIALNVGKLRRTLYDCYRKKGYGLKEDSDEFKEYPIPLHRMATQGDLCSANDSPITGAENCVLRKREGTPCCESAWWDGS